MKESTLKLLLKKAIRDLYLHEDENFIINISLEEYEEYMIAKYLEEIKDYKEKEM